jgi:hypothetical protein
MIFKLDDPTWRQVFIYDAAGQMIPSVTEYNTETREVTLCLLHGLEKNNDNEVPKCRMILQYDKGDLQPITVQVRIPGSYAVDRYGKRY